MPIDADLLGRTFPPTQPFPVTEEAVAKFATAVGTEPVDGVVPPTFPIVVAFDAMFDFMKAVDIDLSRIVHGKQQFVYDRPVVVGDELVAELTVTKVRTIKGADIITTESAITDGSGERVCVAGATLLYSGGERGEQ